MLLDGLSYETPRPRSHTPHSASDELSHKQATWVMYVVAADVGSALIKCPMKRRSFGYATECLYVSVGCTECYPYILSHGDPHQRIWLGNLDVSQVD